MVATTLQRFRGDLPGGIRRLVFGISEEETSVHKRGFSCSDTRCKERLEEIGGAFVSGYQAALSSNGDATPLRKLLNEVSDENLGFGVEGAAMALALLDYTTPWNRGRTGAFLRGTASKQIYLAHVGVGWAIARFNGNVDTALKSLDPLLKWLAVDGMGFYEGFFHWPRSVVRRVVPRRLKGYGRRAFDQGLGRSLWFVKVGNPTAVADTIEEFPASRQPDLWAGAGLAFAYAGGADRGALTELRTRSGAHRAELAQGAAFAAKARSRGGNPARHTDRACEVLCGLESDEAAALTDAALSAIGDDAPQPRYESWRRAIRNRMEASWS